MPRIVPDAAVGTVLPTLDEAMYQSWVKQNNVPQGPDYDMRGYWQGVQQGNPKAHQGIDPSDGLMHYTDYWKLPNHETFSNESQWAKPDTPDAATIGSFVKALNKKDPLLGYPVRDDLFPGEDAYFKQNPGTTGMASEAGDIVLNPYSDPSINKDAVAKNEAMRLFLRQGQYQPQFEVTPEQEATFKGTPYENKPQDMRETILGRAYSGDPSITPTPTQQDVLKALLAR
jgi:hypothetical protein